MRALCIALTLTLLAGCGARKPAALTVNSGAAAGYAAPFGPVGVRCAEDNPCWIVFHTK